MLTQLTIPHAQRTQAPLVGSARLLTLMLALQAADFAVFFVLNWARRDSVIPADAIIAAVLLAAAGLTVTRRRWALALGGAAGVFMAAAMVVEPFSRYRLTHPAWMPDEFALTVLGLACGAAAGLLSILAVRSGRSRR